MFDKSFFLVFVPGYTGSILRDVPRDQTLWVDIGSAAEFFSWRERMDGSHLLGATGLLERVIILNPFTKNEGYDGLLQLFETCGLNANPDPNVHAPADLDAHVFPHDWRQSNVQSAKQLAAFIADLKRLHPGRKVWLMGHSNGGVVARWYIEQEGGKNDPDLEQLILWGSPSDGTPKALQIAAEGFDFFIGDFKVPLINQFTRNLFRSFPSIYQLIPFRNPNLRDQRGQPVDPFNGDAWLDDPTHKRFLNEAREFSKTLGDKNSKPTACFFSRDLGTTVGGTVQVNPRSKRWGKITWEVTYAGDGTIPAASAAYANAQPLRHYNCGHTLFHKDPAVREDLRKLLHREPLADDKAFAETERYRIEFKPLKAAYKAGATVKLLVKVVQRGSGKPVRGCKARATVSWADSMPGSPVPSRSPKPRVVRLAPTGNRLTGEFTAPAQPGYYRLTGQVTLPEKTVVQIDELIAVTARRAR